MALDFSPLYRSTIGFDAMTALFDHALDRDAGGYPPYNIEKAGENTYRIVVALAGWSADEIELVTEANRLVVRGSPKKVENEKFYLHRGHTQRAFERVFDIADHVTVTAATMSDGLLVVDLTREIPEALKARRIEIASGPAAEVSSLDAMRLAKSAA
jgi:molecular chaperone IbpA